MILIKKTYNNELMNVKKDLNRKNKHIIKPEDELDKKKYMYYKIK